MKIDKEKESINRMKLLFEYHFKSNGSQREVQSEIPVKFNEIGDKYSNIDNDFPSFEEYKNEVIIDEDDPTQQNNEPEPQVPQEQPVQAQAPAAEPVQQEPVPAPTPEPVQVTVPQDVNSELEIKLNDQIAKTDQMLQAINMIQQTLSTNQVGVGQDMDVNAKIDQVAKEVEDIKNPSYEKQFDMISRNSYPYNIKLSDYWGWEDAADRQNQEGKEYTITQADIDNYDPNLIKQSLNLTEQLKHISDIK